MKPIYLILVALIAHCGIKAQNYTSTTLLSSLQYPVAFDVAPDGRFFITEKGDGSNSPAQKARILAYSNSGSLLGTFYDLSDSTISTSERGVLGIALDPDFLVNHYIYVYYNHFYNKMSASASFALPKHPIPVPTLLSFLIFLPSTRSMVTLAAT